MYQLIRDTLSYEIALKTLASGTGAWAIDAERANRFRYDQQFPWLIQIFRRQAGCFLFDSYCLNDLQKLNDLINDEEVVIHAAINDLSSLRKVNIDIKNLFDTELACRLLNLPKVNLGTVLEKFTGIKLKKDCSIVDWSTRPLPTAWLEYAANDVIHLLDLKDILTDLLIQKDKLEIAQEEFKHTLKPKIVTEETWRSIKGIKVLKNPLQLSVARELWLTRDEIARNEDRFSPYILSDKALINAAAIIPVTQKEIADLEGFEQGKPYLTLWKQAIQKALSNKKHPATIKTKNLPIVSPENLEIMKQVAARCAQQLDIPVPILVTVENLKTLARTNVDSLEEIEATLARIGLRRWQIQVLAEPLSEVICSEGNDEFGKA